MASNLEQLFSSDSEDEDFVPGAKEKASESSDSCEEESEKDDEKLKKTMASNQVFGSSKQTLLENETEHADRVWESFLNDVGKVKPKTSSFIDKPPETYSKNKNYSSVDKPSGSGSENVIRDEKEIKSNVGPEFQNTIQLNVSTSNSQKANSSKKRSGIESVLSAFCNKKPKISTLHKSLSDWNNFKRDEGLEEEIQHFNKGKQGYIEKQRFLQRSDCRTFEMEKIERIKKKQTHSLK